MSKRSLSKTLVSILGFLALSALNGCSLKGRGDDPSLYVDLSSLKQQNSQQFALLNSGGTTFGLTGLLTAPPTAANGFSCYAVNVTGPGIAETSGNAVNNTGPRDPMIDFYNTLNNPNTYCAYRGVVTPPLFLDGTGSSDASLQIPPGGVRLVQVVGVNDPLVCGSGVVDDPAGSTGGNGNRFFEVGRAVLNNVFADQSISVTSTWPTGTGAAPDAARAARAMDCGNAGCMVVDKYLGGTQSNQPISASNLQIAQRIPIAVGQYIKSVDVNLTLNTADTVTVTLYQTVVASPISTLSASATIYATSVALPALNTPTNYTFNMQAGVNGYLQMQAGYDYWIVVSDSLHNGSASWSYSSGTTNPDIAIFNGGSWTATGGIAGMNYRVGECPN